MLDIAKLRSLLATTYKICPEMVAQIMKCDIEVAKAGLEEDAWRFANPDRWATKTWHVEQLINKLEAYRKERAR